MQECDASASAKCGAPCEADTYTQFSPACGYHSFECYLTVRPSSSDDHHGNGTAHCDCSRFHGCGASPRQPARALRSARPFACIPPFAASSPPALSRRFFSRARPLPALALSRALFSLPASAVGARCDELGVSAYLLVGFGLLWSLVLGAAALATLDAIVRLARARKLRANHVGVALGATLCAGASWRGARVSPGGSVTPSSVSSWVTPPNNHPRVTRATVLDSGQARRAARQSVTSSFRRGWRRRTIAPPFRVTRADFRRVRARGRARVVRRRAAQLRPHAVARAHPREAGCRRGVRVRVHGDAVHRHADLDRGR